MQYVIIDMMRKGMGMTSKVDKTLKFIYAAIEKNVTSKYSCPIDHTEALFAPLVFNKIHVNF